jgi:hypothetical protein
MAGVAGTLAAAGQVPTSRLDSDGGIVLDGERTFLQGLYAAPNGPDGLKRAAAAGFRLISSPAKKEALDQAKSNGLRCWVTVGSDPARIRETVGALRKHPAVMMWETEDEPSYQWKKPGARVSPEVIRKAYALLKQLDPERLVYLNHAPVNLVSTLKAYNPGGDVLATDIYPVVPHGIRELYGLWPDGRQGDLLNTHISQVGDYADKLRQVAGPARATMMVLQAFAWENLREKDKDRAMVLYPTHAQLRFMAWQSIVHGADGLLWWGLPFTPVEAPLWGDLAKVTTEIRGLEPELAGRAARLSVKLDYQDAGHSLDRGVEWIARTGRNGVLLAAVNADPNPVDVTLSGLSGYGSCDVLSENRKAAMQGGSLRETFEPFGVHLYYLKAAKEK